MLFSGKENVFMCLVAFQKMFRKIFSDVWWCSWKYHRKHIFYLLLAFSRLPNDYIISFIPQNTNKTQKKIIKSEQTKARSRSARSQSARSRSQSERSAHRAIAIAIDAFTQCVDRDRAKIEAEIAIAIAIGDVNVGRRWCRDRFFLSPPLFLSLSLLFSKAGSTLKWK